MKLLYVITRSDQFGGAHVHVRDLAVHFSSLGHEVSVVVGGSGSYIQQLKDNNINVFAISCLRRSINPILDFMAALKLRRIIRDYNPDIVSAHSAKAGLLARLLYRRKQSYRLFFTAHGWSFADGVPQPWKCIYLFLEKIMSTRCHQIICVCNSDLLYARRLQVLPKSRGICIHNGMPDLNINVINSYPNNSSKIVKIVCVARFEPQKDHTILLQALLLLRDLPWELDLIGDGPLLDNAMRFCHSNDLLEKVNFLGRSSNVPSFLQSSHIFVLPSHWEGFPRSILEAMRSSLPVVATNVGGVSESVVPGKNGFLINPGDLNGWHFALQSLISDGQMRSKFGKASRSLFLESFTFEKMANKTSSAYRGDL